MVGAGETTVSDIRVTLEVKLLLGGGALFSNSKGSQEEEPSQTGSVAGRGNISF